MAKVTSPPHDVITDAERDAFITADANNVCQVILPPGGEEKFQAAHERLQVWLKDGVMVRDAKPAYYRYQIRHPLGTMTGFFARVAIDPDYETIRRHEMTLPKKRSERLSLLEATGVNTESIWMLYRDERGWVDEILSSNGEEEICRFTDEEGFEHRVWVIDRAEAVAEVTAQFEDRTIVIADGHHRYATQVKHAAATGRPEDASMLVCLVRDTDSGLAIWPTNRLLRNAPSAMEAPGWDVTPLDTPTDANALAVALRAAVVDNRTVVAYTTDGAWKMHFAGEIDQGRGRLDELAVTILHDHLLCAAWGVVMENVEDHLHYSRNDVETIAAVQSGEYPCAVFLAPEPVDAVLDVAMAGHVMPQKATYFVPKLRSGLVMGPCDEPLPKPWDEGLDAGKANFQMPPLD